MSAAPAPDVWDDDLPRFVRDVRAGLHTRIKWTTEPPGFLGLVSRAMAGRQAGEAALTVWDHVGALDGPAALGPLLGLRLSARVHAVTDRRGGWGWWLATVSAANLGGAVPEFCFNLGRSAEPPMFADAESGKQAFEDLCRGESLGGYRVQRHDHTASPGGGEPWCPLAHLPAMTAAAAAGERRSRPTPAPRPPPVGQRALF